MIFKNYKALIDKELNPCRDKSLRGHQSAENQMIFGAFLYSPSMYVSAGFLELYKILSISSRPAFGPTFSLKVPTTVPVE